MGLFSGMGGIGEERLFGQASRLIANAKSANSLLRSMLKGKGKLERIHQLKRDSYELMNDLSNSVAAGGIAPNVIPDVLRLIELEYGIVDMIFVVARGFDRYSVKEPGARRMLVGMLLQNVDLVDREIDLLSRMHRVDMLDELKRLRNQVKLIEEEGDELREKMLNYAYDTKLEFKSFYHITNIAYLADDVLDDCEDSADMITSIMFSIAT